MGDGAVGDVAEAGPGREPHRQVAPLAVQGLVAQLVEDVPAVVINDGVIAARDVASLLQSLGSGRLDA